MNKCEPLNSNEVELHTEFVYCLDDDLGREAAEVGIDELKKNLPYVFAFNETVREITINGEKFTRNEKIEKNENGSIILTQVKSEQSKLPTVYIRKDSDIVIGLPVNNGEVMGTENLPKIYVGMPITQTADFVHIPFIINSTNFEPTKERDALSSDNEMNKELLSQSFELYKELLEEISKLKNIKGLFRTIEVQLVSDEKISQNPLWENFNEYIDKTFTLILEEIPLVETFEGRKEVKSTIFPLNELNEELDKELFEKFYELTAKIKKNIPATELDGWINVIRSFSALNKNTRLYSGF